MSGTDTTLGAAFLQKLHAIVGDAGLVRDEQVKQSCDVDWLKKWHGVSSAVVRPANTAEVAAVMRLCHETRTPVVPQGGNTGMSGGATPDDSGAQLILSTARLTRIREVDPLNNTLTVEAGVLLASVQEAAEKVNRYFPLSLGSEGSCTIGGNLATNAGGIAVLRYGNTRDLVLGVEVVLPNGKIWNGLRALRKDNTGYSLRDLFIGSEGTLGVVTAAVLKLFPRPTARVCAWLGCNDMRDLLEVLARARNDCGDRLVAFEMLSEESLQLVLEHVTDVRRPLDGEHRYHALVELADTREEALGALLEFTLEKAMEDGLVRDAAIGASLAQRQAFWKVREGISLAQVRAGKAIKHDIALPISSLPDFVDAAVAAVQRVKPDAHVINFGHMGDGNLHFNVLVPMDTPAGDLNHLVQNVNRVVHDLVHEAGGSISAEHGVGQLRRDEMRHYKSETEFDLMMLLKQTIDPNQIMNPGKLI
ncbi:MULTISPECIES: FAD-binding oxidoreductase [unclassified Achromobacter]|uniref:FAD-binding oxidoreductase n=1 Tax=unclassified Achromobacter TaxID=2626865 RepID=UPI000B51DF8C|nr:MULTISPECIES: FAD-binding oxidoreductase [unclassified Achromobacter]OWT68903.1 hydroxyacid dehydrogenase [Achromobacter sp. HZ28]OWT78534.1 hydroxyacid dehydrogenase [Achromobacter sp. HZ34]